MHLITVYLNIGQHVAKKEKEKIDSCHIVAKSYPPQQTAVMRCYGSLMNINPSAVVKRFKA